jgi:cysteine desulfurase/selenocysteine lyase
MSSPVYLDNAATSFPKAPGVPQAVSEFLSSSAGNPGRGGHRLSVAASRTVEGAREAVALLLGADPERTLLGPSCTFWLNTLLLGLLREGDRVLCSQLEHNAVMRPLRWLETTRGVRVDTVPAAHPWGVPSASEFAAAVAAAPTRAVVVSHASNVTGALLPVAEIARAVAPIPVIVDAAQSAGSVPLDFTQAGLAALACAGHKGLLGPPGVGVLALAPGLEPPPLIHGGTGSRSESELMPELLPDRLEAGTTNSAGHAGLAAACSWLEERGVQAVHAHEQRLVELAADGLGALDDVELVGWVPGEPRTATLSFRLRGADNGALALWLDRKHGIQLRAGLHCAPAAHQRLGSFPSGTMRVGFGPFNTAAHVELLVEAITAYPRATPGPA